MIEYAAVIPVYNGEAFVGEAVESVLSQTRSAARIVVVDDGSTDGTRAVLDRFGSGIEVVVQPNRGVAAARNAGAERAVGEDLVAFLDADDVWLPTKLEHQVSRFEQDPALGMVHCGVLEVDGRGQIVRTRLDGLEGSIAADLVRWDDTAVLGGGSGAVFRTDLFQRLGGYDETLSMSADWDLFVRAALLAPVGFVAEPLLSYRLHGANMSHNVALLEADMHAALAKAFAADPGLRRHRRRALANLDYAVGGGYINQGRRGRGLLLLARALARRPPLAGRVLAASRRRRSAPS